MTFLCWVVLGCLFLWSGLTTVQAGTWDDLMSAAQSAHQRQDYERAQGYLESALRIAESFPANDERLVTNLFALGSVYFDLERFEEARTPLTRAVDLQERVYGPDHVSLGSKLNGPLRTERWTGSRCPG